MERLTIRTPEGASLKLDNPSSEIEAREQLTSKYSIAMNKLAEYEDIGDPQEIKDTLSVRASSEEMWRNQYFELLIKIMKDFKYEEKESNSNEDNTQ